MAKYNNLKTSWLLVRNENESTKECCESKKNSLSCSHKRMGRPCLIVWVKIIESTSQIEKE